MRALWLAPLLLLAAVSGAAAQPYRASGRSHAGALEASAGLIWNGGYDAGGTSALETPNSTSGAAPLTLFTTSSRIDPAPGVDARFGVYLSPRLAVEATLQYSRPTLSTSVADDFENAAPLVAEQRLSSYLAGASLLYHFGRGRFVPFIAGGGGYLRQLYEENAVVLTGSEIHGGGGVKYWFGTRPHRFGLRVDATASARSRSAGFEDKRRVVPVVGVGLAYLF